VVGLLAGGLALLAAFVAIERRVRWPLVDLALFRNSAYVLVTLLGSIGNIVFVVTTFASTLYLQRVRDLDPIPAGAVFLTASVATAIAGPVAGRLGERYFVPRVMAIAIACGCPGLIVVALDPGLVPYGLGLVVFGFGYGLTWSIVSIGTQAAVPRWMAGEASGVTLAIVIGLGGIAVAAAAALIEGAVAAGAARGSAIEALLIVLAPTSVALGVALAAVAGRSRPASARAP
jgi:hypothetical protein